MEKDFIPHEEALVLKELGFDEPCYRHYWSQSNKLMGEHGGLKTNSHLEWASQHTLRGLQDGVFCAMPLWQQAFDWFREEYDMEPRYETSKFQDVKYHYAGILRILNDFLLRGKGTL